MASNVASVYWASVARATVTAGTTILAAGRTQANEPGAGCCTCLSRAAPRDIGTLKDVLKLQSSNDNPGCSWNGFITGVAHTRGSWQPVHHSPSPVPRALAHGLRH